MLSAMPAAITTFAISQELGLGREAVAQSIVTSTVASVAVIPIVFWCIGWLLGGVPKS